MRHGDFDDIIDNPSDSMMAPLSALQRLTRLELKRHSVRRAQLQQLQLPRLQHLEVILTDQPPGQPLLLGHMTSLTALDITEYNSISSTDQLPPGLQRLKLVMRTSCSSPRPHRFLSLQPLLALSRLRDLHLHLRCLDGTVPAVRDIRQLSTLRSLQEVQIVWDSIVWPAYELDKLAVEGIVAAFQVLPLKELTWHNAGIPAAIVQQLSNLQGLTSLDLDTQPYGGTEDSRERRHVLSPAGLAVVLQQLTALQRLFLREHNYTAASDAVESAADEREGLVKLVQAVGGLQQLFAVRVRMRVRLQEVSAELNDSIRQLWGGPLAGACTASIMLAPTRCGADSRYSRVAKVPFLCIEAVQE
jgi:hypothetical protein